METINLSCQKLESDVMSIQSLFEHYDKYETEAITGRDDFYSACSKFKRLLKTALKNNYYLLAIISQGVYVEKIVRNYHTNGFVTLTYPEMKAIE